MWWASEGSAAPQTPQGRDLTAARCLLCDAVSLLFMFDSGLSLADLGTPAAWFLGVIGKEPKFLFNILGLNLSKQFTVDSHNQPIPAAGAM